MTQKNTMQNHKSNLAKLLATENIQVLQNQVKTASFDVKNRVLTIPFFKHNDNNVVDMLIAHEVSHALHTPSDSWTDMSNRSEEFRSFVNVLEDTRIDKLIQKKYPGVTQNYIKGFDRLWKDDFFKSKNQNLDDYILIDKINLWYKSSKTLPINFTKKEQPFIDAIEKLKTFDDVLKLAEDILGYCKEEMKNSKDETVKIYREDPNGTEQLNVQTENGDKKEEDGHKTVDDKTNAWLEKQQSDEDKKEESTPVASKGAGGDVKIRSVTNDAFSDPRLTDQKESKRSYGHLPKPIFKNMIVPYKQFILDNQNSFKRQSYEKTSYSEYYKNGVKSVEKSFTEFKNKSTPIVNYLVKEFEMRKNARLFARASTDKTGIIDPLKLHSYKYAEDIFKKITIVPNEKNHGMLFLLDWSGSMANYVMPTIEQLLNLVWFVKKVNIPFSVYAFINGYETEDTTKPAFDIKTGDVRLDTSTRLVQMFTNKMTKTDMLLAGKTLYTMGAYYASRYGRNAYDFGDDCYVPSPHANYHLNSTPLDESLVAMDYIIKKFKDENKIDKTVLVALTDGGSNGTNGVEGSDETRYGNLWVKLGKNYVDCQSFWRRGKSLTDRLLVYLKKKHNIKTVGFYLVNKFRDLRYHIQEPYETEQKMKKQFSKDKVISYTKSGYDVYYFVKSDNRVQDNNLDQITDDTKKSDIKRIFSKNMQGRLNSRVVLQRFIKEVA